MDVNKVEAALARRRAQNREAQRKFRREYCRGRGAMNEHD